MSDKHQCIRLTEHNFGSEVLEAEIPVLVDCWASWCGFSQQINPTIGELAIEFSEHLKIGRLNVAKAEQVAACYGVRVVPTLLLFQDGQLVERVIGGIAKQHLTHKLNSLLMNSLGRSRTACL